MNDVVNEKCSNFFEIELIKLNLKKLKFHLAI